MIKAIIIEDEIAAQAKLVIALKQVWPGIEIGAIAGTVKESIDIFNSGITVDIIFCDVQLTDGLSFEIFDKTQIRVPVIFTTGYDSFMLTAFENNGIDYLIKPISNEQLQKAFIKYKLLEDHFSLQTQGIKNLIKAFDGKKRTRIIVKKGVENVSIRLEDIVIFYTENKLVYVKDKDNKKYIADKTLNELDELLDNTIFFRANRQYIINLNFVKSYKPYEKVKLQVDLNFPEKNHFIIVSQITAPHFRKWISES